MQFSIIQVTAFLFLNGFELSKAVEVSNYHQELAEQELEHHKKPVIPILKHSFQQHHEGYQYSYETGNGIHAHETGYIKNKGDEKHETLVQQGKITYHDEHGHPITLTYIADEHGFQPQGDHLPTPPPIPEEIQKALEGQSQHYEEPQEVDKDQEVYEVQYEQREQPQSYGHTQMQHHHY